MRLSIVVTIVDGGEALARCLTALARQQAPPPLEVLIPYDETVPGIEAFRNAFPEFSFLPLGAVRTRQRSTSFSGQHELFDRRRSAGLEAASGDVVAMLEDRGVPRPDWAAAVVLEHEKRRAAVIGGGIGNASDGVLNWAVYLCDFGRYALPYETGPRESISDVNVSYKRAALNGVKPVWQERFHEPLVHRALKDAGEELVLSPSLIVDEIRGDLRFTALCRERVAWGRLFGQVRMHDQGWFARISRVAVTPFVPPLVCFRILRDRIVRRALSPRFFAALPAIVAFTALSSLGEAVGYLSADAIRVGLPRRGADV